MATLTAPSGRTYTWDKPGPPTKQDIDALVAYDSSVTKPAMGDLKLAEEELLDAASDQRKIDVARASARAGGGGFISPPLNTPETQTAAMKEMLPTVAGTVAGSLVSVPAGATIGATAVAAGTAGFLGGAAEKGVRELMDEDREPGAFGRVMAAGGKGVLWGTGALGLVKGLGGAARFVSNMKDQGIRGALASAFSPKSATPGYVSSKQARDIIHSTTGIKVPMGIGEAIGSPELAAKFSAANPAVEMTQEMRDGLKRSIVLAATNLRNTPATGDALARETIKVLQKEVGEISKPVKDAVNELSTELSSSIQKGFDEISNEARTLIPGTTATPATLGSRIKAALTAGYDEFKATDAENYGAARSLPDHKAIVVGTGNTRAWANSLEDSTVQRLKEEAPEELSMLLDQFERPMPPSAAAAAAPTAGGAIPSFLPEGTQKIVGGVKQLSDEQTLQAMRNLRTKIGDSIQDSAILPGISYREKSLAYKAITKDIDEALDALPTGDLKNAYTTANAYHKANADRFVGKSAQSSLKEAGAAGGVSPESLAGKLTAKDAATQLGLLRATAGGTHRGEVTEAAREYLFNHVGDGALDTTTGLLSVRKMRDKIVGLAPEIQAEFFPGLGAIQKAVAREAALLKVSPEKVLSTLDLDPDVLSAAFNGGSSRAVADKLNAAVSASTKAQSQFAGTVMNAIRDNNTDQLTETVARNPAKFVRTLLDGGTFSPEQTKRAMDTIFKESPVLGSQLQFDTVDTMLSAYSSADGINMQRLLKDILPSSPTGKTGPMRDHLQAILGDGTFSRLESAVKSMAALDKAGTAITPRSALIEVATKGIGGLFGAVAGPAIHAGSVGIANTASWLMRLKPELRYKAAAAILTTPELRAIASTPINRLGVDAVNSIALATARFIASTQGLDSPDMQELKASMEP